MDSKMIEELDRRVKLVNFNHNQTGNNFAGVLR